MNTVGPTEIRGGMLGVRRGFASLNLETEQLEIVFAAPHRYGLGKENQRFAAASLLIVVPFGTLSSRLHYVSKGMPIRNHWKPGSLPERCLPEGR